MGNGLATYYKTETRSNAYNTTDRLHTGKEFHSFDGLSWHDNVARFHDTLFPRFTTVDPLAEHAPDVSPYVYCGNNPLRFIDPSGMIERDKNGKIVYSHESMKGFNYEDKEKGLSATGFVEYGFIKTDIGNNINVYNTKNGFVNAEGVVDATTNCFGFVFTNGEFWIQGDQVETILKDDGYAPIYDIKDAQKEDVVIYCAESGEINHVATISATDGTYKGTTVYGKYGIDPAPTTCGIEEGYNRPDGHGNIVQTPTSHIHIYRPPEKDKKNDDNKENRERIHNENIQPL